MQSPKILQVPIEQLQIIAEKCQKRKNLNRLMKLRKGDEKVNQIQKLEEMKQIQKIRMKNQKKDQQKKKMQLIA